MMKVMIADSELEAFHKKEGLIQDGARERRKSNESVPKKQPYKQFMRPVSFSTKYQQLQIQVGKKKTD
eukprot:TRINITY_DN1342_c0_g1_i1.p5 TRINITY_DN1342_c0_g1~~TRINITY_DN1342_c0_g1_i1.p5  ORF type:complete len:68 (-),score=12.30 TRINITY_DN1342_c0_g1_i1:421-624(-)